MQLFFLVLILCLGLKRVPNYKGSSRKPYLQDPYVNVFLSQSMVWLRLPFAELCLCLQSEWLPAALGSVAGGNAALGFHWDIP